MGDRRSRGRSVHERRLRSQRSANDAELGSNVRPSGSAERGEAPLGCRARGVRSGPWRAVPDGRAPPPISRSRRSVYPEPAPCTPRTGRPTAAVVLRLYETTAAPRVEVPERVAELREEAATLRRGEYREQVAPAPSVVKVVWRDPRHN
jgi:hypothetical protein